MSQTAAAIKPAKKRRKGILYSLFALPAHCDLSILLCALILVVFGTIMILSIQIGTGAESAALELESQALSRFQSLENSLVTSVILSTVAKQAIFIVIGYMLIAILAKAFTYERWRIWSVNIIGILIAVLLATLVIGREISGSKAWLTIGTIFFQPSELVKPITILMYAYAVYRYKRKKDTKATFWQIFKAPIIFSLVCGGLVAAQKDFGTLIIIGGITVVCLLVPSIPSIRRVQRWISALLISGGILAGSLLVFSDFTVGVFSQIPFLSHIAIRIENMKNPYLDIYGDGYQPANSLYGIGDAGLFGKGLGNSIRKYGYLTQSESDYILSVIIEETGVIGLGIILVCTGLIIIRLFHYALMTKKEADQVLFSATAAYILLHFIINIGGVGGLIPMTGVPLLFISSGGSSLMAICIILGVCENRISRLNAKLKRKK